ncbi:MAG TPA: hypothetical protein VNO14_12065 [Blastocatellia bacterium]|nr:hypothetical protein [Blastocatellia bacterium]
MDSKTSNRTKARLVVLSIFVIGFVAGALSMNLYNRASDDQNKDRRRGPRNGQFRVVKIMTDKLGLTEDQQEKIKTILSETYEQYDAIREEMRPEMEKYAPRFDAARQRGRERIREVLTPEQLPKFEEMVQEQDRQRAQERKKRR